MQVRDAVPADRPVLVGFIAELNAVEHRWQADRALDRDSADRHLTYLEELVRDRAGFLLVAEHDARLLGFLIGIEAEEDGSYVVPEARRFGCITDIYVTGDARGQGIGRALIGEAERRFRSNGLGSVRVTALAANEPARASYRALGYQALEVTYGKPLTRGRARPSDSGPE